MNKLGTALLACVVLFASEMAWAQTEAGIAGVARDATGAILLACEGAQDARDARRALISRMLLERRLAPQDPLAFEQADWERQAADLLLVDAPVPREVAMRLLAA